MKLVVTNLLCVLVYIFIIKTGTVLTQEISDPFYPTNEKIKNQLQSLADTYPAIIKYQELGKATHGPQPIMALKISDNVNSMEDEPVWVFTGIIHGREQLGVRVLLDLANELTAGYGMDTLITQWVDAYEIWLVMSINPWGYEHNSSGGSEPLGTRKNGPNTSSTSTSGVDLNRNYNFRWSRGGSGQAGDSRFRGYKAFSENETQAIRDLYLNRNPIFGVTFHQGNQPDGGQIMRPWSTSQISDPPDENRLFRYSYLYANWVFASRYSGPFCEKNINGSYILQDPDGTPCGGNEDAATYCAELCWKPTQTTLGAYGQSSNWCYAAVGTMDYTIEISDRLFNENFLHSSAGPTTDRQQKIKNIASEFSRNHREAIKSWFKHFLYSTNPFKFNGPGLTGHITDAQTGASLVAVIEVEGFTSDYIVDRTSNAAFGRYWRLLPPGTYSVKVSAIDYKDWQGNVTISNAGPLTELNVALEPSQATSVAAIVDMPDKYYLSPAYPNPFNAQTQFLLQVKQKQYVEIEVFDLLGRKVATLHKDVLKAGETHVFKFDANMAPSGLYLVSIRGEKFNTVKRITLIK